jgi:hypothetical protein
MAGPRIQRRKRDGEGRKVEAFGERKEKDRKPQAVSPAGFKHRMKKRILRTVLLRQTES